MARKKDNEFGVQGHGGETPSSYFVEMYPNAWTIVSTLPRYLSAMGGDHYWGPIFATAGWIRNREDGTLTERGRLIQALGPGPLQLRRVLDAQGGPAQVRGDLTFLAPYSLVKKTDLGYRVKPVKALAAIRAYLNAEPDDWDIL